MRQKRAAHRLLTPTVEISRRLGLSRTKPILLFSVLAVIAVLGAAAFAAETGARLEITPSHTEVYVDGLRVGIADDFDGLTQRLRVDPGEHMVELYLDGYRPVRQTIAFTAGETYRIRHRMEPLPPGETTPPRPERRPATTPAAYDALGRPISGSVAPAASDTSGRLSIRVQPGDAVILVDGEEWRGSTGDRLELQVTAGAHRIEIRRDGYQPFGTEVTVRAGETAAINVSLTRSQEATS